MIAFPAAKINLGLSVVSKRADGFHNLETVFYPIPLYDILEITASSTLRFLSTGLTIPGLPEDNLVLRSYRMLKERYPRIGPLEILLHKKIPMGAGLGGGSSDAASFLQLVDRLFKLNISERDLEAYALTMGSDCPFFLKSLPCLASGRGEVLETIHLDLSAYSILLIHPGIHVETAKAFLRIRPETPLRPLKELIQRPVAEWRNTVYNAFEIPVFEDFPDLRLIKEKMYESGAIYASLTGSGSTIYGIFQKDEYPNIKLEKATQTYIRGK